MKFALSSIEEEEKNNDKINRKPKKTKSKIASISNFLGNTDEQQISDN
jgi:hypothetical protein